VGFLCSERHPSSGGFGISSSTGQLKATPKIVLNSWGLRTNFPFTLWSPNLCCGPNCYHGLPTQQFSLLFRVRQPLLLPPVCSRCFEYSIRLLPPESTGQNLGSLGQGLQTRSPRLAFLPNLPPKPARVSTLCQRFVSATIMAPQLDAAKHILMKTLLKEDLQI
jgi:hypothetical protein